MGREKSFLRTCLLPMGASMEPRYNDEDRRNNNSRQHHVLLIDDENVHVLGNDGYHSHDDESEQADSDEEFGDIQFSFRLQRRRQEQRRNRQEFLCRSYSHDSLEEEDEALYSQSVAVAPKVLCLLALSLVGFVLWQDHPRIVRSISFEDEPPTRHFEWDEENTATSPSVSPVAPEGNPRLYFYNTGILQWEQVGEDLEHMAIRNDQDGCYSVALSWDGRPVDTRAPPNHWQPALMPARAPTHATRPVVRHFSSYQAIPTTNVYKDWEEATGDSDES